MSGDYVLIAGTVVTPDRVLSPGWVAVRDGTIANVGGLAGVGTSGEGPSGAGPAGLGGLAGGLPAGFGASRVVDLGRRIVTPGSFDLHVHGGDGAQVNGDRDEDFTAALTRIARFHARHGTTSLLATTVSDTPERLLATVQSVGRVVGRRVPDGATIRGIHLEGPWIAQSKIGAHDPQALRPPDVDELRRLAEASGGSIRMLTLAPELPGSDRLQAAAVDLGIGVAIGHSDADYDTTRAAIEAGARHATHLFNAMVPLHHRRPGAVTALLLDDRVSVEVIADLEHVHAAVLALVARCAPGRLVAVSDATPATGLGPGSYQIGRMEVAVAGGRATLTSASGTLAGSVLTMDRAVRNLVAAAGISLPEAVRAASTTPARAAGCAAEGLGSLAPGAPADLVVLEPNLSVAATIVAGEVVFDPAGAMATLGGPGRS
jgi:N-acetylglucosamine-6-phosphate deacetylase